MHIDLTSVNTYLAAIVALGASSLFSPKVRQYLMTCFLGLLKKGYLYLFDWPNKLNYSKLSVEQQITIKKELSSIILSLVKIEEALLPDSGLGEEKKKNVIAKLTSLGIPAVGSSFIADLIDDAVKTMDEAAKSSLDEHKI